MSPKGWSRQDTQYVQNPRVVLRRLLTYFIQESSVLQDVNEFESMLCYTRAGDYKAEIKNRTDQYFKYESWPRYQAVHKGWPE